MAERESTGAGQVTLTGTVVPLEAARKELLEMDPVTTKLRRLIDLLQREVAVRELGQLKGKEKK